MKFSNSLSIFGGVFLLMAIQQEVLSQSNQMAAQWAGQAAGGPGQVGKPQFHLNGGGGGNNGGNWGAQGNIGIGTKVWESQNGRHSIGVGANYGRSVGSFQGHSYSSRPDLGVGAGYAYRFG